ncbi:hypothetical protein BCD67_05560 [Oscillatoriales cyanobacterium USR001]|nr:hypothetical protein BCD67_05560 [Oscillatoriales cyanobacterium USR001]
MTNQANFLPLQEVISKILTSREVTGIEINLLSLLLRSESLEAEDKNSIYRVFYAFRRGWLTLIDISDEQVNSIKHWLEYTVFAKV